MTGTEFKAACQLLWDARHPLGWVQHAAEFLNVSERNVYYFAAGSKGVPAGVSDELLREIVRRLVETTDGEPAFSVLRAAVAILEREPATV